MGLKKKKNRYKIICKLPSEQSNVENWLTLISGIIEQVFIKIQ